MFHGGSFAFIPVQRPGGTGKNDDDLLFVQVVVIAANGSWGSRSEMNIGNAPYEIKSLSGRGKAEAAGVAVA